MNKSKFHVGQTVETKRRDWQGWGGASMKVLAVLEWGGYVRVEHPQMGTGCFIETELIPKRGRKERRALNKTLREQNRR